MSPLCKPAVISFIVLHSKTTADERGAVGRIRIGRGNRSTLRNPVPLSPCPHYAILLARFLMAYFIMNLMSYSIKDL
jgi:hypothetical protein